MLTFSTIGLPSAWTLTDEQLREWAELYPGLDVETQCRMALAWTQANQRKTAKGMPRFLVNWLNRAVSRGEVRRRPQMLPERQPWRCPHVEQCASRSHCASATFLGRPEKVAS
jgi:uncharacterized protein (DUF2235 family)